MFGGQDDDAARTFSSAGTSRGGKYKWFVVGAVVLALSAGAGAWLSSESEKAIVLASTAPGPATDVPAAALPPAPMAVSTAAILEEVPIISPGEKSYGDDEIQLLSTGAQEPGDSFAAPAGKKHFAVKHAPVKMRTKMRPTQIAAAPGKIRFGSGPKAVAPDSDVALLAAMVEHSKAIQPKRSPAAIKLGQCKTLRSVADAERCRARLCAGTAKYETECKAPDLANAAPDA